MKTSVHPSIMLGFCGAITGVINYGILVLDWQITNFMLGLCFGAAVALYLVIAFRLSKLRAFALVIGFGLSWFVAYWVGFLIALKLDLPESQYAFVGLISGAIGAAIVVGAFTIAYRDFATRKAIIRTIAVGTFAGVLLRFGDHPYLLFVIWQGLIGVSLGWDKSIFMPVEIADPEPRS